MFHTKRFSFRKFDHVPFKLASHVSHQVSSFVSFHEMPHNLNEDQKRTLRVIAVITVHQLEDARVTFKQWADNAYTKDGTLLFGEDRDESSLHFYCRQSRLRNLRQSYKTFLAGGRSGWKPLKQDDINPLLWLQDRSPIRALTREEFAYQSQRGSLPSILTMPRNASKTPPRSGRKAAKEES